MMQLPGELASGGFNALEGLLQQAEQATSHYEALNIEHSATGEQIAVAYKQASAVLQLALAALETEGDLVVDARERVERAVSRIAHAHTVLSNCNKRAAYDRFAVVKKTGPLLSPSNPQDPKTNPGAGATPESDAEENRRRNRRFPLSVPSMVVGYDRKAGKWEDRVDTVDVSRAGITLRMSRRVRHGNVLHLTLPLPDRLRNHGMGESDYRVYALVRRVQPVKDGRRITAVEFIGEHPPVGYLDKPWATFQTRPWSGAERRREPRQPCGETVWVEYFNENLQCLRQGAGQTEDVSEGGLRVKVKNAPPEFEFARISYPERGIESYAIICNRFLKRDGLERLCLQFIDNSELVRCTAGTQPDIEAFTPPSAPAETDHVPMRGKHILIADDDLPLRRVLGKILTAAGYDVTLVEDGKAAVEKAAEVKPDLVITDGLMPKMHGFLVCKTLKEMQPAPKVIMLTAVYTKLNYRFEARDRYGADELLTKPFEVASLLECIERHLNTVPQALAG